jgi:hypothetical protein
MQGRWDDLSLLPISNRELVLGKLLPPLRSVAVLWFLGLAALIGSALLFPTSPLRKPEWYLFAVMALVVLPPNQLLLGALMGLRAASTGEAQWQIGVWVTALPFLVLMLMLLTGATPLLFTVSPLAGFIRYTDDAHIASGMWLGLVVSACLGIAVWQGLSLRLREWAVPTVPERG